MMITKLWVLLPDSLSKITFLLGSNCRDLCRRVQSLSQPTHVGSTHSISQLAALGGGPKDILIARSGVCRVFVYTLN